MYDHRLLLEEAMVRYYDKHAGHHTGIKRDKKSSDYSSECGEEKNTPGDKKLSHSVRNAACHGSI